MALAPTSGFLCGARSCDRSRRFLSAILAGANGSKRSRSRTEQPEAFRNRSSKPASLQAAPGGIAVRNGRFAKATRNAANDRAGREASRPVYSDDSERGVEFGRVDSQAHRETSHHATLLFRDAVRYRGGRAVFFSA